MGRALAARFETSDTLQQLSGSRDGCPGLGRSAAWPYIGLSPVIPFRTGERRLELSEQGCVGVRTFIQSGNVIFDADPTVAQRLALRMTDAIEERFGCRVPVVLRNASELTSVLNNNPFLKTRSEPPVAEDSLHLYFMSSEPSLERLAHLDYARSLPDTFVVAGREIYLHLATGMGRTKVTNTYFEKVLSTICTARNWRTVSTLARMMSAESGSS